MRGRIVPYCILRSAECWLKVWGFCFLGESTVLLQLESCYVNECCKYLVFLGVCLFSPLTQSFAPLYREGVPPLFGLRGLYFPVNPKCFGALTRFPSMRSVPPVARRRDGRAHGSWVLPWRRIALSSL